MGKKWPKSWCRNTQNHTYTPPLAFRRLWRRNGDAISTAYAGSAAIRKDNTTSVANLDSGLKFGKQMAKNMRHGG